MLGVSKKPFSPSKRSLLLASRHGFKVYLASSDWERTCFLGMALQTRPTNFADEKHQWLKARAKSRGTTLNRLIDQMTTFMLAECDVETCSQVRAERGAGNSERGLALLEKAAGC